MSSHNTLIILIAALIVTAASVLIFRETGQTLTGQAIQQNQQEEQEKGDDLVVLNVVGSNIYNKSYNYIAVQVRYDGDAPLNISDTHIELSTERSTAVLPYRNGTATRDVATGFFTQ